MARLAVRLVAIALAAHRRLDAWPIIEGRLGAIARAAADTLLQLSQFRRQAVSCSRSSSFSLARELESRAAEHKEQLSGAGRAWQPDRCGITGGKVVITSNLYMRCKRQSRCHRGLSMADLLSPHAVPPFERVRACFNRRFDMAATIERAANSCCLPCTEWDLRVV